MAICGVVGRLESVIISNRNLLISYEETKKESYQKYYNALLEHEKKNLIAILNSKDQYVKALYVKTIKRIEQLTTKIINL